MKLAGILILFVAAILVLKYSLSPTTLFLLSLFSTIFFAIMVGSYRPYKYEVDEVLHFFCGPGQLGIDPYDDVKEDSDEDDDYNYEYHGSDGYDEDEDDNGSEDEVGWNDDEGCGDNLQNRIEDFIAKVNDKWREEKIMDKLCPG